jgi:hypothetical protein
MKVKLLLRLRALLFFQIIFFTAFAQNRSISGTVLSKATGKPLAGASVSAKGTNIGTVTDDAGNFRFNAPSQAKALTISYIGMATREISIPAS